MVEIDCLICILFLEPYGLTQIGAKYDLNFKNKYNINYLTEF